MSVVYLPPHLVTPFLLAQRAAYVRENHERSAAARRRTATALQEAEIFRQARLRMQKARQ